MNESQPDPAVSSADVFLAEQRCRRTAAENKKGHIALSIRHFALTEAADHLKDKLHRPKGGRCGTVEQAMIADALLAFVESCRELEADDRLDFLIQAGGPSETEKLARAVYVAALTGNRWSIVNLIEAIILCPRDKQKDIWALVGWFADSVAVPPKAFINEDATSSLLDICQDAIPTVSPPVSCELGESSRSNETTNDTDRAKNIDVTATQITSPRLIINMASLTITFDGVKYESIDRYALTIFGALWACRPQALSSTEMIKQFPDLKCKKFRRVLDKLDEPFCSMVRSRDGYGYWIVEPERVSS